MRQRVRKGCGVVIRGPGQMVSYGIECEHSTSCHWPLSPDLVTYSLANSPFKAAKVPLATARMIQGEVDERWALGEGILWQF